VNVKFNDNLKSLAKLQIEFRVQRWHSGCSYHWHCSYWHCSYHCQCHWHWQQWHWQRIWNSSAAPSQQVQTLNFVRSAASHGPTRTESESGTRSQTHTPQEPRRRAKRRATSGTQSTDQLAAGSATVTGSAAVADCSHGSGSESATLAVAVQVLPA